MTGLNGILVLGVSLALDADGCTAVDAANKKGRSPCPALLETIPEGFY